MAGGLTGFIEKLFSKKNKDIGRLMPVVERIKETYNQAWERNWGFVSMSEREIDHMAAQFRPIYIPDLVPFVELNDQIVGFGLAIHPHDPHTIWTIPLNGDSVGRFMPDGRAAVWQSRDEGATWTAQTAGLPQRDAYVGVLREAMATDTHDPAGVYFGTSTGQLFGVQLRCNRLHLYRCRRRQPGRGQDYQFITGRRHADAQWRHTGCRW